MRPLNQATSSHFQFKRLLHSHVFCRHSIRLSQNYQQIFSYKYSLTILNFTLLFSEFPISRGRNSGLGVFLGFQAERLATLQISGYLATSEGMVSTEAENSGDPEFSWLKKLGVGARTKEIKFYESFKYDGVVYRLYDCVYMQNKDREAEPYIGKLVKIWKNPDNSKKIKVQWFFRPSEVSYWLEKHSLVASENELFFASGDGPGLANVNPLEAIAGKCFVVCVSRDGRNPQPSEEQLQMADYVFYRLFDVGQYSILDKMDDKVGGLEVRFVFNRQENGIKRGPILGSKLKENHTRTGVVCEETLQHLGKKPHEVVENIKRDGNHNHLIAKEGTEASYLLSKDETSNRLAEDSADYLDPRFGKRNTQNNSSADVNAALKQFKDSTIPANQGVVVEMLEHDPSNLDDGSLKRANLDDSAKLLKDRIKVERSTSYRGDVRTSNVVSPKEKTKPELGKDTIGVDKHVKSTKDSNTLDHRPSKKLKVQEPGTLSEDKNKSNLETTTSGSKAKGSLVAGSSAECMRKAKLAQTLDKDTKFIEDSKALDDRASKKLKVQESVKLSENKNKNNLEKENITTSGSKAKGSLVAGSSVEDARKATLGQKSIWLDNGSSKEKPNGKLTEFTKNLTVPEKIPTKDEHEEKTRKLAKSSSKLDKGPPSEMRELNLGEHTNDSSGMDNVPSKVKPNGKKNAFTKKSFGLEKGLSEEKLDEKIRILSNNSSTKISKASIDVDDKMYGKIFEVTRRPGKGKWFKSPEGRMLDAHEERRLVLLENLDPNYTSGEVEDIVWSAFQENCTAKVIQRTAFSSPLNGQALVIFGSRKVAEAVVGKLNDGCLLLLNRRPLIGRIANLPQLQGEQCTFYGHWSTDENDKNKAQMKREQNDGESSSHSSQPNSVEYELAMEWCLLQKRSNFWWSRLHKAQGEEYKKLMAKFKSN